MSILIKNAVIYTPQGVINGCLLTQGNSIKYVGARLPAEQADETIDARGGIVLPGLVNAHTHMAMSYFRSFGSDLPLNKWLDGVLKAEDNLDSEIVYYGTALAAMEAMESGTTSVNDMYFFCPDAVRALTKSGLRACVGRSIVDVDGPEGLKRRLDEQIALEEYNGTAGGRITAFASLHAEYTCTENAVRTVYEHARERGLRLHMHISETVSEVAACRQRHNGMSPLVWLNSLNVLDVPTVAAHCVAVSNDDIDVMAQHKIYPVHNPISNLKLASGIAPVALMLSRGIPVALGTDGNGSNNNLDMLREMFTASLLQKGEQRNAQLVTAKQALEMATEHGAEALGLNCGRLAAGALADITVLNPSPYLQPAHDPYGLVVYSAEARDVSCVIVDGRVTVRGGQCITMDKQEIIAGFNRCIKRLIR